MTRSLALFLTLCLPCTLAGQDTPLPPLAFLGFEAGTRLTPAAHQVRALGGRGLRCDRSRRDRAVHECRGTVFAPGSGTAVELWLSAVDSAAGVLTLSGSITGAAAAGDEAHHGAPAGPRLRAQELLRAARRVEHALAVQVELRRRRPSGPFGHAQR